MKSFLPAYGIVVVVACALLFFAGGFLATGDPLGLLQAVEIWPGDNPKKSSEIDEIVEGVGFIMDEIQDQLELMESDLDLNTAELEVLTEIVEDVEGDFSVLEGNLLDFMARQEKRIFWKNVAWGVFFLLLIGSILHTKSATTRVRDHLEEKILFLRRDVLTAIEKAGKDRAPLPEPEPEQDDPPTIMEPDAGSETPE